MDQHDLVVRASAGDQDAFAALATSHIDRCYALAFRILRDPDRARDATQQALLGAWRDLQALRDPDRFDAWIHRLVVHACYAESRTNRRWNARLRVLTVNNVVPDPANSIADRGALEDAFGRLTPEHRAVVVLHHHLGYPLTEIAATLGIPIGTARSRLHYAVRQLRAVLDADRASASLAEERPA
ncbi:MAG TPA: sigma-70 family RNA polymerase sigma factor [Candidatus Limnocylindrales bacterium]|nr:sigma-70 family RNA polymerase sigma factor [Candidatus Limnocylindrales bacterium]